MAFIIQTTKSIQDERLKLVRDIIGRNGVARFHHVNGGYKDVESAQLDEDGDMTARFITPNLRSYSVAWDSPVSYPVIQEIRT